MKAHKCFVGEKILFVLFAEATLTVRVVMLGQESAGGCWQHV